MPASNPVTRPHTPYSRDLAAMGDAVREAGAAVKELFGKTVKTWEKDDRSPVTEADHAANDILKERLRGHAPAYGWLSEECEDDNSRLNNDHVWVVDPVDGTRAFLKGLPHFSVCVALLERGSAVAAIIYNPITEEMFEAAKGGGAYRNGAPLAPSETQALKGARMLGMGAMFTHPDWPRPWPEMTVDWVSSTAYRMALVAAGDYDAMIALQPKYDWDLAAGALIAAEAGAAVGDHLGGGFQFNEAAAKQKSVVTAAPGLHNEILERLSHL
ncbi:MAG: 3'(2'),5'-bisphosphate nucleotidase CysQ [Pseudomonadota bacterium]